MAQVEATIDSIRVTTASPERIIILKQKGAEHYYWIIDSNEIGICKYCGRKRNFKRLSRKATESETEKRQAGKKRK